MPHLLYIGQMPAEGTGSPVIILRHLQRLASAGWTITIIAEAGQDDATRSSDVWMHRTLPLRRVWWPPFRSGRPLGRKLRTWLLAGECHRLTRKNPPDAVLGYLAAHDDFYTEIAAHYARRFKKPLSLLVHDDATAFATGIHDKVNLRRRHQWILRSAHRTWFVSPELATLYGLRSTAAMVLPPISAPRPEFPQWQTAFTERPRVYYAGFVWPAQLPLLAKIATTLHESGAVLVLLTRETPALAEFCRNHDILHLPPFATNREALTHLASEAAGLLVAYARTVDEMPWIATSFPSKLVEYSQLGLPCAIVAPAESAVGLWAKRTRYSDFFLPSDQIGLTTWGRDLLAPSTWQRRSESVRRLADGEFNPDKIQATFAGALLRS